MEMNIPVVIRIVAAADGSPTEHEGRWLKSYDLEAFGGRGQIETTTVKIFAKPFKDAEAALMAWKSQSKTRPLRPDGKPNRPLTAYTVAVEPTV